MQGCYNDNNNNIIMSSFTVQTGRPHNVYKYSYNRLSHFIQESNLTVRQPYKVPIMFYIYFMKFYRLLKEGLDNLMGVNGISVNPGELMVLRPPDFGVGVSLGVSMRYY